MKKTIQSIFVVLYLFFAIACKGAEKEVGSTVEEFAMLHVQYQLMLDKAGLDAQICDACTNDSNHYSLQLWIIMLSDEYDRNDIQYEDGNAHDFSEITCVEKSRTDSSAAVSCNGMHITKNRDGQVAKQFNFSQNYSITLSEKRLCYCPSGSLEKTKDETLSQQKIQTIIENQKKKAEQKKREGNGNLFIFEEARAADNYFLNKDYDKAIMAYQRIISSLTASDDKKAYSLLYQALSFQSLGDNDTARIMFKKVTRSFPESEYSGQAQAILQEM